MRSPALRQPGASQHFANGRGRRLDYPFQAVDAIVAIAAFPLTVAVLWLLLRSPAGGRLVAVPSAERWHGQPTPTFGGIGIFGGFVGGVLLALAVGAVEWSGELGGILAGVTLVFAAGPTYRHLATNPLNEHTNASIAVSGGDIFIRTHKHLWCISQNKEAKEK